MHYKNKINQEGGNERMKEKALAPSLHLQAVALKTHTYKLLSSPNPSPLNF
jgi:hypothetical protein